MTDCVLPATGSNPLLLVLLAFLVLAAGLALVLGVRRRGIGGAAAVVVAVALGAGALVVSDARRADAQECPPETTVAPTAAPTTIAATATTTPAATTTTAGTTTTTAATTTTTVGAAIPTNPTFPTTTAATTTTGAVPDLTPSVAGPSSFRVFSGAQNYTLTVTNLGTAPTNGQMVFPVTLPATGSVPVAFAVGTGWTAVTLLGDVDTPTTVTITSTPGFFIPAGGTSTLTLQVSWNAVGAGQFQIDVTLPTGIGGETNGANNTVTPPFVVDVLPFIP